MGGGVKKGLEERGDRERERGDEREEIWGCRKWLTNIWRDND